MSGRSSYEDSLIAQCLIRTFLDKGGMEDPIQSYYSKVVSNLRKKKQMTYFQETRELLVGEEGKVIRNERGPQDENDRTWTERGCKSQMGKILNHEGAPHNHPKNMDQQERRKEKVLNDFQLDIFRNEQIQTESQSEFKRINFYRPYQKSLKPASYTQMRLIFRQGSHPDW